MVVAESAAIARDGAERVVVDWEPLPGRDHRRRRDAPTARRSCGTRRSPTCASTSHAGDAAAAAAAFARAAHVVRLETRINRVTGVPHGAARGRRGPRRGERPLHGLRGRAAASSACAATSPRALGVPESAVRVVARDVGGNYGTRNSSLSRSSRSSRGRRGALRPAGEVDVRPARGAADRLSWRATSRRTPSWPSTPTAGSSRSAASTPATSARTRCRSSRSPRASPCRRSVYDIPVCVDARARGASPTPCRPRRTAAPAAPR